MSTPLRTLRQRLKTLCYLAGMGVMLFWCAVLSTNREVGPRRQAFAVAMALPVMRLGDLLGGDAPEPPS